MGFCMTESCSFHSEHQAVEFCEECRRPLCGLCLWYTGDGHRLCEEHARLRREAGEQVLPPQTYQEAIGPTLREQPAEKSSQSSPLYRGNNYDLSALVTALIGFMILASCSGGIYCMPVAALALGLLAYSNADKAVDPGRTRLLAGVGLGVVGLMVFAIISFITLYVILFAVVMTLSAGRP